MEKKLLVLDLDETLIFSREEKGDSDYDFEVGEYYTLKRNGLDDFISGVFEHFDVGVWTSAGTIYAHQVVSHVFKEKKEDLKFIWARPRCTRRYNFDLCDWVDTKPLNKLKKRGIDLKNVLAVDDSPEKFLQNYGNLVRVKPFEGQKDNELEMLLTYLISIKDHPNYRKLEKRYWRSEVKRDFKMT